MEVGGKGIAWGTGNVVKSKKGFWATTDKEGQRRTCWDTYHHYLNNEHICVTIINQKFATKMCQNKLAKHRTHGGNVKAF